jgi:hypothetical protein
VRQSIALAVLALPDRVAEPAPQLTLGAIDRPSTRPHALRVLAAGDEYWFEYRPPAPVLAYESDDAAPGVVIHAGSNGLGEPSRYSGRNLLLYDPVSGRHRLRVVPVDRAGNRSRPAGGSSAPSPGPGGQLEPEVRAVSRPPTRPATRLSPCESTASGASTRHLVPFTGR